MTPPPEPVPVDILVVDDHPSDLFALKALLQRPGCNVVLASSGEEALSRVLRQEFALVVLDVGMPKMDGFQVASTLKGREQSKRIPILFLTASVYDMQHIFRAFQVGAVDYLRKPLDPQAVRAKVGIFVELFRQRKEIERQAQRIRQVEAQDQSLVSLQADQAVREADRSRLVRELENGIRVRDDFLSIAAHELKTPVTPLRLRVASLLREAESATPIDRAKLVHQLASMDRATGRLVELVEHLLEVSRASVGAIHLELAEADLTAVVDEVVRRHRESANHVGASIVWTPGQPVRGLWDRVRMEQVVDSLLSNAIKYGVGAPIEVTLQAERDVARLEVRDHGRGIPPEDQERIFERFERVTPPRHYSGFGLGLWVTRQVVVAHGGSVSVRSRPGEGATFTVELPLRRATEAAGSEPRPAEGHP